jgi:GNAT superfamily N-acetyltransferase
MGDMIEIGPLRPHHREGWETLARGYKAFYRTEVSDAGYEETWLRLVNGDDLHGIVALLEGKPVGIAHYLFHANVWSPGACYLQDLFVDEATRGLGVARALIEEVADATRARGLPRLYWNTKQDNIAARALYDKVARFRGFVCYEHLLDTL